MRVALTLLALAACGKGSSELPPNGSSGSGGSATRSPGLHVNAKLTSATLIVGSRRVAITTPETWAVPTANGACCTRQRGLEATLAKLRGELGELELFLGAYPVAVGGEEHHEKYLRFDRGELAPRELALEGHLVRIAAVSSGTEIWQLEERLRAKLVTVDAAGTMTPLPALELLAPPAGGISPVGAKKCAAPLVVDLAATADAIGALIVECNHEAPVRIVTYSFATPSSPPAIAVAKLASPKQLGFEPTDLVMSNATRAIIGIAGGKLAVHAGGQTRTSLAGITLVADAAIADDGSIWTLTIAGDRWQVARDGELVTIADPDGKPLQPLELAFDATYGIVVLAASKDPDRWLLVER